MSRHPIAIRITGPDGETLQEICVAPLPFWTVAAFEARWLVAAPLRALRRVFGRRTS